MRKFFKQKGLKIVKGILIFFSGTFLVISVVLGIIIWSNCNNPDFSDKCSPYGNVASIFATISIGIIPLYIFVNNRMVNKVDNLRKDKDNTAQDLHDFTNLLSNYKCIFVTNVLNEFCALYHLDRFEKEFFVNDKEFVSNEMENAIIATDPNWPQKLLDIINSNIYFLPSDDPLLSVKKDSQKIDFFVEYLYSVLNKMEIFAYNFVSIRTLPETYRYEESPSIENMYFKSYFFLVKTHNNNNFSSIDVACDIIIKGGDHK